MKNSIDRKTKFRQSPKNKKKNQGKENRENIRKNGKLVPEV